MVKGAIFSSETKKLTSVAFTAAFFSPAADVNPYESGVIYPENMVV
jgi:hypothetical protein